MGETAGYCLMMPNNENDNREVSTNSVHSGHKHSSFCSVIQRSNISAADDISQHLIISNKKTALPFVGRAPVKGVSSGERPEYRTRE